MIKGRLALPGDGAPDVIRAAAMVGPLMGGDTQEVQRIGMSGIDADDLLVQRLGLFQLACLVVLKGLFAVILLPQPQGILSARYELAKTSGANHPSWRDVSPLAVSVAQAVRIERITPPAAISWGACGWEGIY